MFGTILNREGNVSRKKMSLAKYLANNIKGRKPKRVKGVIGMLIEPEDFMTVLAILSGQDKNLSEIIQLYEVLFRRFRLNSHLIDGYMIKEEWHVWTEVLIEMSNVLWKWRNKFKPNIWLETNAKIYEVAFRNFKDDAKYSQNGGLCFMCSRLFTEVLFNFASHAREGDKSGDFHISSEKVKEISKKIGTRWDSVTHANIIEDKISKHSL